MTDRPLPVRPTVARAMWDGTQTQTRRPAWKVIGGGLPLSRKELEQYRLSGWLAEEDGPGTFTISRPAIWQKVKPGDRFWLKESCRIYEPLRENCGRVIRYKADENYGILPEGLGHWSCSPYPAPGMPRWASRMTLVVTDVRIEPVQEITEEGAIAEGIVIGKPIPEVPTSRGDIYWSGVGDPGEVWAWSRNPRAAFAELWDSLYASKLGLSWAGNPEVVRIVFERNRCNIDQMEGGHV